MSRRRNLPLFSLALLLWLIVCGLWAFSYRSRIDIRYLALAHLMPGRHIAAFLPQEPQMARPTRARRAGMLTLREQESLRLVAMGMTTAAAAERLGISPETVRTHVRNAMNKLGARTRAQAIAIAMRDGEIPG